MFQKWYEKKNYIIYVLFIFISLIVTMYNIRENDLVAVLNDEFGYWGNAAVMSGLDWRSLMAETPYYSCGYSILLLPLFYVIRNPRILYQIAILMNAFFLFGSLTIAYYFAGNMFNITRKIEKVLVSFIAVLNVPMIYQLQSAWPEVLLNFLFWLMIYLIYLYEQKAKVVYEVLVIILFWYMYLVHERTLPIIILGFIAIAIMNTSNKSWKGLVLSIVLLVLGLCLCRYIQSIQTSAIYNNSTLSSMNKLDLSEKAGDYIQRIGVSLNLMISSFISKFSMASLQTYFLFPVAVIEWIIETITKIKRKELKEVSITRSMIVLMAIVMLGLTSIHMMNNTGRKDIPVYTRYFDYTVAPIALYGCSILRDKIKARKLFSFSFLFSIVLFKEAIIQVKQATLFFNVPCSPFLGAFYQIAEDIRISVELDNSVFIYVCVYSLIVYILMCIFIFRKSNVRYIAVTILVIISFCLSMNAETYLNEKRDQHRISVEKEISILNTADCNIYFIKDDMDIYSMRPKYLQFCLYDKSIIVIESEAMIDKEESAWVLTNLYNKIEDLQYVDSSDYMNIYFYQSVLK